MIALIATINKPIAVEKRKACPRQAEAEAKVLVIGIMRAEI
jgi:hypothetical protein